MDESITIKYGLEAPFTRWIRDLWTKSDRDLAPWIAVILLSLAIFYGPRFILNLGTYLPVSELGNSGASIFAHTIILLIAGAIALLALYFSVRIWSKPSAICFDQNGIRKIWSAAFIDYTGKTLPWSQISSISIRRPEQTTDPRNYLLCFSGTSSQPPLTISLGQINDQKEDDYRREHVLKAITKFAQAAQIEPTVADVLAPKRSLDFTEIWLNALSAPPGREHLFPVTEGTILDGRYRVLKRLGAGGQGTVYLATDSENNDERVVLKETILPVYADLIVRKQALENFHKEAHALESLKHERIVKFKRSFVADQRAYLVLQFIDGITLSQRIKTNGSLSPSAATRFALQIADILEVLHESSPPLVHRDLTPDNLMIDSDDNLVLIDFAVAVNSSASGDETSASQDVAGKAAYMAPEQFMGRPNTQSDLYSLGGVLFFMLTGAHPEPLTSSAPTLANDAVPEELNSLVMKATAYNLKDRFENTRDLRAALLQIK